MRSNRSIRSGDTVAYSAKFLRSISAYTGNLCFAHGKVKFLRRLSAGVFLARVDWDKPGVPGMVNVSNLVRVDSLEFSYE
jgi:hypothetical protein